MKMISFRKLSIKKKLITSIMGISTFILLASLSVFISTELLSLKKSMREDLWTLADLVGKNTEGALMFLDNRAAVESLKSLQARPHIISSHLFDSEGQVFARYHQYDLEHQAQHLEKIKLLIENNTDGYYLIDDHIHLLKRIIFEQDNNLLGFIHIESDREIYWQRVSQYSYTIIIMLFFALLLSLFLAFRAQKTFMSPILKLLSSMEQVSAHQSYSMSINNVYHDEFGVLIKGYNDMLKQLEQQQQMTKNYQKDLEKRVEERTRQLKTARDEALSASRTKSIFLANMSHEIRTPMNAILGFTQLLQQSELNTEQLRKLTIIDNSGKHLLSLINDILELSKIEAGSLEITNSDFDLLELLQDIENMFKIRCEQQRLKWEMNCFTNKSILLNGDQGKIRQILINLIGNACKFTDHGGVSLTVENTAENQYKFIIKDTGTGIEEEALSRIFDAFHQERQGVLKGGTGLGLNITQRHIQLLSGDLQVRSTINQGSEFFFTLTLLAASESFSVSKKAPNANYTLKTGVHLSALVVDDVKDNTDLLSNMLIQMGFRVIVAENGQIALDIIAEKCPDIVFMDIRMPVMNGIEAIQKIRQEYSSEQLKCIAVSASGLKHNEQYFMAQGYDLFISKPFRFEAIYHAIKVTLDVQLSVIEDKNPPVEKKQSGQLHIKLEKQFVDEIIQAAEYGQLTELGKLKARLNEYGEAGKKVANHLELLINTADFNGIVDYMGTIVDE